ncbi:MAG: Oxygen-independent coproporphyrinogen-III oxidase-like protein YqeR [Candidatus Anoxychlamydiales bacterium]|nr:Oxygen-independent coproporphyrinogen-III oxidase-like protein YqeR [Candidatus Anoxychlamydiales bacterium]
MLITGKISIYIHIPFCEKKCPYCQFYSVYPKKDLIEKYKKALILEIRSKQKLFFKRDIVSIYFGGGTPSIVDFSFIDDVLNEFNINNNTEITIETNPENVTVKKFEGFKKANINRVSIGAQSLDDNLLKVLNRSHSSTDVKKAIDNIKKAKIDNISIDLMYDIPHQLINSFEDTLDQLKYLDITHVSLYNLTFEENTFFHKNKDKYLPYLPKEKDSLKMLNKAISKLKNLGFLRYEISAFSKKGCNSKHNLGYWQQREFLGFGVSSFSYFNQTRHKNISNIKIYIKNILENKNIVDFEERLSYPKNIIELLLVNLRVIDGVNIKNFQKNNGKIPSNIIKYLDNSIFIKKENNRYKLSKKGLMFYDSLASDII